MRSGTRPRTAGTIAIEGVTDEDLIEGEMTVDLEGRTAEDAINANPVDIPVDLEDHLDDETTVTGDRSAMETVTCAYIWSSQPPSRTSSHGQTAPRTAMPNLQRGPPDGYVPEA